MNTPLPRVVVVGRPNVGKSTLVNRLAERRQAIVGPMSGLTRDRLDVTVDWRGRDFIISDTGGMIEAAMRKPGETIDTKVASKAMRAASEADVVLFIVDVTTGVTSDDLELVKRLRTIDSPIILVANKADDANAEAAAAEMWSLGLGEPMPVSSTHGRGSGELLDRIVELLPAPEELLERPEIPSIAIVGRPNVGKSSLFNRLAGEERVIVHHEPGTTRDSIDTLLEIKGKQYRFIDTAGVRGRSKTHGVEVYSAARTREAISRADLAILMIDSEEGVTGQDQKVAEQVAEEGASAIVALNKWDVVEGEEAGARVELSVEQRLFFVAYAPVMRISAKSGRGVDKLAALIAPCLEARRRRISTPKLNELIQEAQQKAPIPRQGNRNPRILYGTQASVSPPQFVLFSNVKTIAQAWLRFLERRIREEFDFTGTPLRFKVRPRERDQS